MFLVENIIGVIYDYYVIFYFDFDVDGLDNLFFKVNFKRQMIELGEFLRKSYMKVVKNIVKIEKDVQIKFSLYDLFEFYVVNFVKIIWVGNFMGYKIVFRVMVVSLFDYDDFLQKRVVFINN